MWGLFSIKKKGTLSNFGEHEAFRFDKSKTLKKRLMNFDSNIQKENLNDKHESVYFNKCDIVQHLSPLVASKAAFLLLRTGRKKNYRHILYDMCNEAVGKFHTAPYTTWKNRFHYPHFIASKDVEIIIPAMDECLRRVLVLFLNEKQDEKKIDDHLITSIELMLEK